jgi:hypothetical protein
MKESDHYLGDDPVLARNLGEHLPLRFLSRALKINRDGLAVHAESLLSTMSVEKFLPAVTKARKAAERERRMRNLRSLAIALVNYEAAQGHFPAATVYGPDGKTPHSWRVAILPYVDHELYLQYRFNEPWDSPANRKLLARMPAVFRGPETPPGTTDTSYYVLTGPETILGPETIFDGKARKKGTRFSRIQDGASSTLLLVEAKRSIPWTKPEDIPYDPKKPLREPGGVLEGVSAIALVDGSTHVLQDRFPDEVLHAMITKAGGESGDMIDQMLRRFGR